MEGLSTFEYIVFGIISFACAIILPVLVGSIIAELFHQIAMNMAIY